MDDRLANSLKLQDLVFNTIGSDTIDLPQVVVVGSQSSGKSSVLENIGKFPAKSQSYAYLRKVGRDFLPRGTGIVTRRPLILQLINVASPTTHDKTISNVATNNIESEWAEFLHLPGRRFSDFNQVRTEIEQETSRIAGMNKGINRSPIHLKIFSAHVLNLTLVDLPGLTKIPIGDQPGDIERQVLALIREYIAKPNSIILAVSPANVDLVNSEGLKLARQVDSQGKRTIGVLTKLDLMDHGTNALDILSGRVYPLKLGFIGCVNRSQQDILGQKSLAAALQSEIEFFQNHPAYRNISNKCGTAVLAKTLNSILMHHIREKLPDIKARLNTLMGQTQQELISYGGPMAGEAHRGSTILQLMTHFATNFVSSIDGTSSEISTKELCGGARIYQIFNAVFGNALTLIDPIHNLSTSDIRTAIRNSTGPRASLFVPELAFDLLVKPQIQLLEPPSQRCVELVYEELMKICHSCGGSELARYPRLQMRLIEVISELLRERLSPTSSYVENLIAIQRAYINTNHPNFLGGAGAVSRVLNQKSENEKRKVSEDIMKRENQQFKSRGAVGDDPTGASSSHEATEKHQPNGASSSEQHRLNSHLSIPTVQAHVSNPGQSLPVAGNAKDGFLTYFFGSKEHEIQEGALSVGPNTHVVAGGDSHFHMNTISKQMESIVSVTIYSYDFVLAD